MTIRPTTQSKFINYNVRKWKGKETECMLECKESLFTQAKQRVCIAEASKIGNRALLAQFNSSDSSENCRGNFNN